MKGACKRPSFIEEWRKEVRALNKHYINSKDMNSYQYNEVRKEIYQQEKKRNKK